MNTEKPPVNIFGLTRKETIVCGLPLVQRNSLTPAERVWLQENSEAARHEANAAYLEFVDLVKDKFKYKTQEDAYHAVKAYYRGELDAAESDKIELLSLQKPLKRDRDIDEQELTYLIGSRLIAEKFPTEQFEQCFGIAYTGEWTMVHTKAIAEIHAELIEFFSKESEGKKEVSEGK